MNQNTSNDEEEKSSTQPKNNRKKGFSPPGNQNQNRNDSFQWTKALKTLVFWAFILLIAFYFATQFGVRDTMKKEIPYTFFITLLENDLIEEAVIEEREFHGKLKSPSEINRFLQKAKEGTLIEDQVRLDEKIRGIERDLQGLSNFTVILLEPPSWEVIEKWRSHIDQFEFKPQKTDWVQLLINFSPWILLIVFWIFILRRMQGGSAKSIFSFGKSRAKLLLENRPKVSFKDVAGADEAKQELQEIIEFLKEPEKFQRLGGKIPKGALLLGPPGTGKTLLAKAVSGEAGVPFFSMSGADFVEMFVGVGASRVRDLFEQGKKNAPCIIFIDEIDAVGRQRGAGLGGGHDEREQTLNQLLVEMDGFDSNEGVILLAATNRPDVLDHALLRPGRFDRQIVVDRPDVRGREGILKVHTKNIPLAKQINLSIIAKGTPGFSGADLANLVNEAALLAARRSKKVVSMSELEESKDKVLMGAERKSMLLTDEEKRNTAYHESGHVLVSKNIPGSDPIHKVTIIPRGRALGLTTSLPIDEKHNHSRTYIEAYICKLLGGRAAEQCVFNEITTGSGDDIDRATEWARRMVCDFGMSDKLGPLSFGKKNEEIFLGREIAQHRDYSEKTAQMIDDEVKNFVLTAERKAKHIIETNIDKLHKLASALLEKEALSGDQIDKLLEDNGQPIESKDT
ncbi:ATP-dependent zinc metalloprotease FtsH [candidate division KSB1 bacterium]|nr:ATP-dependent zinc metalloprotease FtsH [candidate division KSB1 bacterium]